MRSGLLDKYILFLHILKSLMSNTSSMVYTSVITVVEFLNFENFQILTALTQKVLQAIKKSFEYAYWDM